MALKASTQTFSLNEAELQKADEWLADHSKKCAMLAPPARDAAIYGIYGGLISYVFAPNSVAYSVEVKCVCGEGFDVTDYESW